MIIFPPAKINLGLKVLRKRPDGYHDIETCMLPIPLFDVLEILPAQDLKFVQTGNKIEGEKEDNLVLMAWRLLHERHNAPKALIHLQKHIPTGAGLGGGSSDAAFLLRGMNTLFELKLSSDLLQELAAELGSDCPFFIKDQVQFASGRGEILSSCALNLKDWYLKVVYPGIHVSTAQAYAGMKPTDLSQHVKTILELPVSEWKALLINDFEASVFSAFPQIAQVKEELYTEGAVYASMSGSGSAVFGLFETKPRTSQGPASSWVMQL